MSKSDPQTGAGADSSQEEIVLYVRDRRKPKQFMIDNLVMDEWLPILGPTGYTLYCLLVRMSNEAQGESCSIGLNSLSEHLGMSRNTILQYIELMEYAQLVFRDRPETEVVQAGKTVKKRRGNKANTYYILDVPAVTPAMLVDLQIQIEKGGLHQLFASRIGERILRWRPIQAIWAGSRRRRIKTVVGQAGLFDEQAPPTPPAETPSESEKPERSRYGGTL